MKYIKNIISFITAGAIIVYCSIGFTANDFKNTIVAFFRDNHFNSSLLANEFLNENKTDQTDDNISLSNESAEISSETRIDNEENILTKSSHENDYNVELQKENLNDNIFGEILPDDKKDNLPDTDFSDSETKGENALPKSEEEKPLNDKEKKEEGLESESMYLSSDELKILSKKITLQQKMTFAVLAVKYLSTSEMANLKNLAKEGITNEEAEVFINYFNMMTYKEQKNLINMCMNAEDETNKKSIEKIVMILNQNLKKG